MICVGPHRDRDHKYICLLKQYCINYYRERLTETMLDGGNDRKANKANIADPVL